MMSSCTLNVWQNKNNNDAGNGGGGGRLGPCDDLFSHNKIHAGAPPTHYGQVVGGNMPDGIRGKVKSLFMVIPCAHYRMNEFNV